MNNKEIFVKAVERFQNYRFHKENKNSLLGKAFNSVILDSDGIDELFDSLIDISLLIFPNLSKEEIGEYLSWYLLEADDMEYPIISTENKKYEVSNTEILYDMLYDFN